MRELKELVWRWLDRIPPEDRVWHPDAKAVQLDHRQQDLERQLAELDIYIDTIQSPGDDDGRTHRRAV